MGNLFRLVILLGLFTHFNIEGQIIRPPAYTHVPEHGDVFLKKDKDGYYFKSEKNKNHIIFYKADGSYYKIYNKQKKVLLEGALIRTCADCHGKNGKWIERYEDGVVKSIKHYCQYSWLDKQIGQTEIYYPNGNPDSCYIIPPENIYNDLRTGLFQTFYENGSPSIEGYYTMKIDSSLTDTTYKQDPESDYMTMVLTKGKLIAVKTGKWLYYNEVGEIIKEEEYK